MKKKDLVKYLNKLLNIYDYQDYGPNGLQVEGKEEIKKIVFAVSATKESCEYAASVGACALVVHHGLFWKFHGAKALTGAFYKRVAPLIKNDISLIGYHLPLDGHLEFGNAAAIAKKLGATDFQPFAPYKGGGNTGIKCKFDTELSANELKTKLKTILNHEVIHSEPESNKPIASLGIITGGANSEWRLAKSEGLDAYLTGEISEHDWHESREDEIHYFAGGHNATEQFGVQSLMEHLKVQFKDENLDLEYFASANPA